MGTQRTRRRFYARAARKRNFHHRDTEGTEEGFGSEPLCSLCLCGFNWRFAPVQRLRALCVPIASFALPGQTELRQGDVVVELLEDDFDAAPYLGLGVFRLQ